MLLKGIFYIVKDVHENHNYDVAINEEATILITELFDSQNYECCYLGVAKDCEAWCKLHNFILTKTEVITTC